MLILEIAAGVALGIIAVPILLAGGDTLARLFIKILDWIADNRIMAGGLGLIAAVIVFRFFAPPIVQDIALGIVAIVVVLLWIALVVRGELKARREIRRWQGREPDQD